jgi:hypothetical protein
MLGSTVEQLAIAGLHVHGSLRCSSATFSATKGTLFQLFLHVAVCDGHSNHTVNLPPGGIPSFGRSLDVLASLEGGSRRSSLEKNK